MTVLNNGDLVSSNFTSINIWNTTTWTVKRTIDAHSDRIGAFALLANGDLASGSFDRTIKIVNPIDGTLKRKLTGHTSYIYSLAVMNNGLLVSASFDYTVRIWNV
jgi:WD40 repeat protein